MMQSIDFLNGLVLRGLNFFSTPLPACHRVCCTRAAEIFRLRRFQLQIIGVMSICTGSGVPGTDERRRPRFTNNIYLDFAPVICTHVHIYIIIPIRMD